MLNAAAIITALNEAGFNPEGKITGDFPNAVQRFYASESPEAEASFIFPQVSVTFNLETGTVGHIRGFIKNRYTNSRTWRSFRRFNDEEFNLESVTGLVALIQDNMVEQETARAEAHAAALAEEEAARVVPVDPAMIDESEEQDFVGGPETEGNDDHLQSNVHADEASLY